MPFWWRRRNRPWYGRWYKRRRAQRFKRRKQTRYRRRRTRKPRRRRRRRLYKVRRKKKTLAVRQWQPDCIRKCKIVGYTTHVLGAHGKQFACYADTKYDWTPPLQPSGGGFTVEKFSLQYLYEENRRGNNIWTQSNKLLDLVRYTGGQITFYRHPHIDFLVHYTRMLPMNLEKFTYPEAHPMSILLKKHKKAVPSLLTKPHGKRTVKIKFKPPKQMTSKWFFQQTMASTGLLQLTAAAADLRYPSLGCCNENRLMTFYALNLQMYKNAGWGNNHNVLTPTVSNWYIPTNGEQDISKVLMPDGKQVTVRVKSTPYHDSINYDTGWFQTKLMQAIEIIEPKQTYIPTTAARYNPTRDTGEGNQIWLQSILNTSYGPPATDKTLILEGLPLWQLMYGFTNYVQKVKGDPTFLETYVLLIRSKFIEPAHTLSNIYLVLDKSFILGKGPFDSYVTTAMKQKWFPTVQHQQKTINDFVTTGPFIPKLENLKQGTWELYSKYKFFFKFGGASLPDADTADPQQQATWVVPTNMQQTVQVANPQKCSPSATLHSWDFRRGLITSSAFKRMCENQETDTDVQTDTEPPQKKKKTTFKGSALQHLPEEAQEIEECLLSLYKEDTCQEIQENQDLLFLINQQQQQQQELKHNLLKLINHLKAKQQVLQLQTGILE